jgi:hypothetical protein
MEDVFARIKKSSEKLNQAADAATAYILDVEGKLSEAGASVDVEGQDIVTEPGMDDHGEKIELYRALAFTRVGERWRIVHRAGSRANSEDHESVVDPPHDVPLLDCDRATRVECIPYINDLLNVIAQELEYRASRVEATLGTKTTK